MPNLLNSTVFNYFLHIGQFLLQTGADISKWTSVLQSRSGITKLGKVT